MPNSKICLFLLFVICVGAFLIRAEGIKWPKLHPDEHAIGAWVEKSLQNIYIKDRVYPNGFFMLARPFVFTGRAIIRLNERFDYNCGKTDRIRSVQPDGIYCGRWFNVWAGALLCAIMFLFVSRMTRSQWAGLLAAGLIGFSQYAVEHCHYAETDIAALLCLAGALWFWAIARDTSAARWFIAAAFISGFAAGTKFTLMALGVIVFIEAILFARRRSTGGWRKQAIGAACLGLLLFGAGFTCANPAVLLDFKWFWAGMAAEKQRIFSETMLNLGYLGAQPGVKYLHHLWRFCGHAVTLGLPWIVLIAVGLPCAVPRLGGVSPQADEAWVGTARRYWSVLILFPAAFAFYWIFMAPWVRSQEFLFFMPSFTALAVLPLIVLWRSKYFIGRALALIFALMALVVNGGNGLRIANLFGWKDTRIQAMEWLQINLPLESRIAAESYAEAGCPATLNPPLAIRKIERDSVKPLIDYGADYLLRAAGVSGRGLRHPLSGKLYSEPAVNLKQFMAGSTLLCSWAPLPPQGLATFISPVVELYGMKRFAPTISLQAELPQPALIVNADQNPVGRQTFFPVGHGLGCAKALLIDRLPQTIAVGGPESLHQAVFLVLNTAERPAVIDVRGFGMEKQVALEPYDTCVVPLKRPEWRPRVNPFETITLKAAPVKDVLYIPCFARIAFTVGAAARIFLDTGREDKIAEYFPEELLERELSPDLKYIISTKPGLRQIAERSPVPDWGPSSPRLSGSAGAFRPGERRAGRRAASRLCAGKLEKCLQTDPSLVSINGVSGYYYEQFARARLQQPYDLACGPQREEYARAPLQNAVKIIDLKLPEEQEDWQKINQAPKNRDYYQTLTLPVLVARGKYELRGEVMLRLKETRSDSVVPLTVFMAGETDAAGKIELQPGQWRDFSLILQPGREIQPCLELRAPVPVQVHLRNMEIGWSLVSALESVRNDLAAAGRSNNEQSGKPPPDKEWALKDPPVFTLFTPWLALVGFDFDPGTREIKCVFEARRNDTPKLAATFWLLRRGEWRKKQVQALGVRKWLNKGERETVAVRLNQAFSNIQDSEKLGLGIETDVLWHAGAIPAESGAYVIPFSRLAGEHQKAP